jgi:hypothetical protein
MVSILEMREICIYQISRHVKEDRKILTCISQRTLRQGGQMMLMAKRKWYRII